MAKMVKLVNVSKFYHEGNIVTLGLRKVNLEFDIGEFVAITGESGSGKSTLLNVISGIDTYEDGEIFINDCETSFYEEDDWEEYRKNYIGFIFQNYNLIDSYTVLENVEAAMIIQGIERKERIVRAKEIIEKVGLTNRLKSRATKLSGGEKQRLAIARALAKNTKIIVADEPTGNLDSETGKQIMQLLYEISKEKLVLMVTHNYEEASSYVTRKIRLFDGEVVEDRAIKDYKRQESISSVPHVLKENSYKKALIFSLFNLKNQPKRTTLLFFVTLCSTLFVFLTCVMYFVLSNVLGTVLFEKYNSYFENNYDERIVVTKMDKTEITDDEIANIKKINGVVCVIENDIVLDNSISINYLDDYYYGCIRSALSIKESNLSCGVLPQASNEIVIKGNFTDEEMEVLLNTKVSGQMYLSNYETYSFIVVGIVNDSSLETLSSATVYFSEKFFEDNINDVYLQEFVSTILIQYEEYSTYISGDAIIDTSLTGEQIVLPAFYNDGMNVNGLTVDGVDIAYSFNSDSLYYSICISQAVFDRFVKTERTQVSVDAVSENKVDKVMSSLASLGFYSTCPSQTSSDYGSLVNMIVSIIMFIECGFSIVVIYIVSYLVIKTILLNKKKDYTILRTIGIDTKTIKNMSKVEMLICFTAAFIIVSILFLVLKYNNIKYLSSLLSVVNIGSILIIFIVNILTSLLISRRFNNVLMKKSLLSNLKVE